MQIELTGTNIEIDGRLRRLVGRRFARVARQVPEEVHCEVVLAEEHNPRIAEGKIAEANLRVKGGTINAKAHAREMSAALGRVSDEIVRQLRRRRDRAADRRRAGSESIRTLPGGI
ncbi:MAG: ribosome-associated translation inhibitor RaiA [Acidobacteria bacterium]|nr:ribosome-associated translation inhibitor RaiA [Solirubrobacteraceae bacterium]MBU6337370.1 ribosome-associated translation inhibitor RaiA [Acidobacteriota bacterium]